jgi:hypothetical protein
VPTSRRPTSPRTSRRRSTPRANGNQASSTRGAELDLEIVTITPELAQEWLDRGGNNRKVTRRRIEAMTAAIQRGEWQLTGEAIKLDDEGRVRDGQNRLHAIVQAGIPVRSVVARGVSEDAFDVMDTGRSRNAADVLHIHGFPSQNALAAAARGLMFIERYGRVFPSQRDSHLYITPAVLPDWPCEGGSASEVRQRQLATTSTAVDMLSKHLDAPLVLVSSVAGSAPRPSCAALSSAVSSSRTWSRR